MVGRIIRQTEDSGLAGSGLAGLGWSSSWLPSGGAFCRESQLLRWWVWGDLAATATSQNDWKVKSIRKWGWIAFLCFSILFYAFLCFSIFFGGPMFWMKCARVMWAWIHQPPAAHVPTSQKRRSCRTIWRLGWRLSRREPVSAEQILEFNQSIRNTYSI